MISAANATMSDTPVGVPSDGPEGRNSACSVRDSVPGHQAVRDYIPVDLTGQLSNPQPALEALADLIIRTPNGASPEEAYPPGRIPRATSRTSRPLKPAQVDALVAGYKHGKTMKELAAEFDINRVTVSAQLRRANVRLRQAAQSAEASRRRRSPSTWRPSTKPTTA